MYLGTYLGRENVRDAARGPLEAPPGAGLGLSQGRVQIPSY